MNQVINDLGEQLFRYDKTKAKGNLIDRLVQGSTELLVLYDSSDAKVIKNSVNEQKSLESALSTAPRIVGYVVYSHINSRESGGLFVNELYAKKCSKAIKKKLLMAL